MISDGVRRQNWLKELKEAQKAPRLLEVDDDPYLRRFGYERCVICDKETEFWLMPENAPLCSKECMQEYLKDPTVYDPRELYTKKGGSP
jgi:hypothetical protein